MSLSVDTSYTGGMTTAGQADCPDHQWTFLTNYTVVLYMLNEHPDMLQRELAKILNLSENGIQRIINELEVAGYVIRERVGRRNRYHVDVTRPLRQICWHHRTVGELLEFLAGSSDC